MDLKICTILAVALTICSYASADSIGFGIQEPEFRIYLSDKFVKGIETVYQNFEMAAHDNVNRLEDIVNKNVSDSERGPGVYCNGKKCMPWQVCKDKVCKTV